MFKSVFLSLSKARLHHRTCFHSSRVPLWRPARPPILHCSPTRVRRRPLSQLADTNSVRLPRVLDSTTFCKQMVTKWCLKVVPTPRPGDGRLCSIAACTESTHLHTSTTKRYSEVKYTNPVRRRSETWRFGRVTSECMVWWYTLCSLVNCTYAGKTRHALDTQHVSAQFVSWSRVMDPTGVPGLGRCRYQV